MPIKTDTREYRDMIMRVSEENTDDMNVTGYASVFNHPYELYREGGYIVQEQVDARAFDKCDMDDVIFQYDHSGRGFARTANKTLTVMPDDHGLLINARLGGTTIGKQLYEEIKGGYTSKMSFGFVVTKDTWTETKNEDGTVVELRTIEEVGKLYDVSAVSIPANDATSISVRSISDGVIEKAKAERLKALKAERAKKLLALKIKMIEEN